MDNSIIAILLRNVSEGKSSIEQFLANGNAKSYEEYCRMVGEYTAYSNLEQDIKEIEKRFIDD